MSDIERNLPHLQVPISGIRESYAPKGGGSSDSPERNRAIYAALLGNALGNAVIAAQALVAGRNPDTAEGLPGAYFEFQLHPNAQPALKALESKKQNIELVAVKTEKDVEGRDIPVSATIFIPQEKVEYFSNKIEEYRTENTEKKGRPKNEPLISRIENVRIVSSAFDLFVDPPARFPNNTKQKVWWEIWLRKEKRESFLRIALKIEIHVNGNYLEFPERDVYLVYADSYTLDQLVKNSDLVAEIRSFKDSLSTFTGMNSMEQQLWEEELFGRVVPPSEDTAAVCILDSGINVTNSLIRIALSPNDRDAYNPAWGIEDAGYSGHGTGMGGIALYGNLFQALVSNQGFTLKHRLESVKILPPTGQNPPQLYGTITSAAIAKAEIKNPQRKRVICLAVTSIYETDRGRPSSWSSELDQQCYGDDEFSKRLIIVSAGNINVRTRAHCINYIDRNDVNQIENPGQSWNALIVGAYTEKSNITEERYRGWKPVAPVGELSPFSRTSVVWDNQWPIKPDVVFEGGNLAFNGQNEPVAIDDLQLLTLSHSERNSFTYFNGTSAATALASNMAAKILTEYPNFWPETIRALIVHSAEWTPVMKRQFEAQASKKGKLSLLRRYGYGVPNISQALRSARNDLTLVIEDKLFPLERKGSRVATREMNFHALPWPREELRVLGAADVELRITLSYYIEPNPNATSAATKHRYASHGFRFAVKKANETEDAFKMRINKNADSEGTLTSSTTGGDDWFLGGIRNKGSVHSDTWCGSAADLAERDAIAVFPTVGWWRDNPSKERWNSSARYSLIVSIKAPPTSIEIPNLEVDIYTSVANEVASMIEI